MCGIVGFSGARPAAPVLLEGLRNLEYRGYDSSGIAVIDSNHEINVQKCSGKLINLYKRTDGGHIIDGNIGIAHTRWATHGIPNDVNAHPHYSDDGKFAIVHNGIIENYLDLREDVKSHGIVPKSQTDSELIAHLMQINYKGDVIEALHATLKMLQGSYAIGIICTDYPDTIFAARKDNPLVIGLSEEENFIASDVPAFLQFTKQYIILENGDTATVKPGDVTVFDSFGNKVKREIRTADWDIAAARKDGYKHFMLKEIYEQPSALEKAVRTRIRNGKIVLDDTVFTEEYLRSLTKIDIIGCGSAYHAGIVGKNFIETLCRLHVDVDIASEYRYRNPITDASVLTIIISQSGETADTLAALRLAKERGSRVLAIINVVGSSIAREADDVLYTVAGPEIAVATTKGYVTQVALLQLFGIYVAGVLKSAPKKELDALTDGLYNINNVVADVLKDVSRCEETGKLYSKSHCAFFLGRGLDYALCLEGALKLKEISYIHAESYAAGELKHGTISLIEDDTLVIAVATQTDLFPKMLSNIQSVKARGANVIAVAAKSNAQITDEVDDVAFIPDCHQLLTPIPASVILQLFAYYVANNRPGCDIDKPKNLAKSVTVE